MDQEDIQPPQVSDGPGYGYLYSLYLSFASSILRSLVASMSGKGESFDKKLSIETPGLGDGQVPISVCLPKEDGGSSDGPKPLVLVAEGGGFILGQPNDGEHVVRPLSDKTGAVIISVEYAKSPRWPYPHALLQLYQVLKWALSPESGDVLGVTIDPSRVAVMGNSAGGNLMASLSLLLSFKSGPVASFRQDLPSDFRMVSQVLIYPSLDQNTPYSERYAKGDASVKALSIPSWVATMMEASYLPPSIDKKQVFVAPLMADTRLLGSLDLPDALILTAGKDCLKYEGQSYAENLRQAGVNVDVQEYPEAIHGFSHYKEGATKYRKDDVEDCWDKIATQLGSRFKGF